MRADAFVALPDSAKPRALETLEIMRRLAHADLREPEILATARQVALAGGRVHDARSQASALLSWVRSSCRYIADPIDQEVLASPLRVLASGSGDCDELACLLACLLAAVGIPSRFVAVTWDPSDPEWRHVYVEALIGGRWLAADPAVPDRPLGGAASAPEWRRLEVAL